MVSQRERPQGINRYCDLEPWSHLEPMNDSSQMVMLNRGRKDEEGLKSTAGLRAPQAGLAPSLAMSDA